MTFPAFSEGMPVIVQGITGRFGSLHSGQMRRYGTNVAAGVTPGKGGESVDGVPVYNTVRDAVAGTSATVSVLFVPASNLLSAAEEALAAGVKLLVPITEHVPIRDTLKIIRLAREKGALVVGPNTAGVIVPSLKLKLGIMPPASFSPGGVAVFSRSGSLMYEIADSLSRGGIGQYVALGVGGDPVTCTALSECVDWAAERPEITSVVIVGEIGGSAEELLAAHIVETRFPKPVVAYVAGKSAPREKHMGHAGAIISGQHGTAEGKVAALKAAGAKVAADIDDIPKLVGTSR